MVVDNVNYLPTFIIYFTNSTLLESTKVSAAVLMLSDKDESVIIVVVSPPVVVDSCVLGVQESKKTPHITVQIINSFFINFYCLYFYNYT